mmetsp:Transcript_9542/g.27203  ORF Transcript_9542/g.27203 Transcript_9542/m.27203 type:complete len:440 (+) Transcript_9542:139-1458(+)
MLSFQSLLLVASAEKVAGASLVTWAVAHHSQRELGDLWRVLGLAADGDVGDSWEAGSVVLEVNIDNGHLVGLHALGRVGLAVGSGRGLDVFVTLGAEFLHDLRPNGSRCQLVANLEGDGVFVGADDSDRVGLSERACGRSCHNIFVVHRDDLDLVDRAVVAATATFGGSGGVGFQEEDFELVVLVLVVFLLGSAQDKVSRDSGLGGSHVVIGEVVLEIEAAAGRTAKVAKFDAVHFHIRDPDVAGRNAVLVAIGDGERDAIPFAWRQRHPGLRGVVSFAVWVIAEGLDILLQRLLPSIGRNGGVERFGGRIELDGERHGNATVVVLHADFVSAACLDADIASTGVKVGVASDVPWVLPANGTSLVQELLGIDDTLVHVKAAGALGVAGWVRGDLGDGIHVMNDAGVEKQGREGKRLEHGGGVGFVVVVVDDEGGGQTEV